MRIQLPKTRSFCCVNPYVFYSTQNLPWKPVISWGASQTMRGGILCLRYSPSRPPSRAGRSSAWPGCLAEGVMTAGSRRGRLRATHSRGLAGAFPRPPARPSPDRRYLTRHGGAPSRVTAPRRPAHWRWRQRACPWAAPALLPAAALWSAAVLPGHERGRSGAAASVAARRGARRAAGGRGGSHDPARRGGSGSARCVRGLAGPQPAQRLPRAIPAPLRSRRVRTEGLRGKGGGREGGREAVVSRPPAGRRHGRDRAEAAGPRRALAREAARAWTGRGTGERPRGCAREAQRFLSRWDAWESIPPATAGGSGAALREAREARRTSETRNCAELCWRPTLFPGPGRLGLWVGYLL